MSAHELITEHLDLWTQAVTKKSTAGRGSNGKVELTGIKKLRELILELAVRGKLVEQDPDDEPAQLILERLDSTVKKNKGKPQAYSGASQSSLPKGWASFRVGDYLDFQYGKSLPAKQRDNSGSTEVYGSNGVVGFHTEALTEESCIIVGRKGSAGALNKALAPSWTTDVAYYVQPPKGFDFEFTYLLLQSLHLDQLGKGIKPGVNRNEAYALTTSLPPLAEQHRIVQKVDELMALCDRLEQHTSDQLDAHETLVDTLLGTLTQSANATVLADNWARLAEHFDTLFTTEQSIDKLKQTILQLAVMGRLVEQDARDEPAETIVQKLNLQKQELIESGDLRQPKPLPVIEEQDLPFELPDNWKFVRLGSCVRLRSGTTFPKERELSNGRYPYCKVGDMNMFGNAKYITTSSRFIDPTPKEHLHLIPPNSIVFPKRGGAIATNKKRLIQSPVFVDLNVMAMTPYQGVSLEYLLCWLETIDLATLNSGTSVPQINNKDIEPLIFPLPPFHCQQKIVLKVKELMALCDHLKQRLTQASETRCQLAKEVVEQAIN